MNRFCRGTENNRNICSIHAPDPPLSNRQDKQRSSLKKPYHDKQSMFLKLKFLRFALHYLFFILLALLICATNLHSIGNNGINCYANLKSWAIYAKNKLHTNKCIYYIIFLLFTFFISYSNDLTPNKKVTNNNQYIERRQKKIKREGRAACDVTEHDDAFCLHRLPLAVHCGLVPPWLTWKNLGRQSMPPTARSHDNFQFFLSVSPLHYPQLF